MIKNTLNSKSYIGSAINVQGRWRKHKSLLNRNIHINKKLQNSWNKSENVFEFILLEKCDSLNLIEREQYYIDTLKPFFNIRKIASSNLGLKTSIETREKMSNSSIERYKNNPELRDNLSMLMKGNTYNLGRKSKRKGIPISETTRDKISKSRCRYKEILQYNISGELVSIYTSIQDARVKTNIKGISRAVLGKRGTAGGFTWKENKTNTKWQ